MTDVEGSTRGWEAEPELMRTAMVRQVEFLAGVIEGHGGFRPGEEGEGGLEPHRGPPHPES